MEVTKRPPMSNTITVTHRAQAAVVTVVGELDLANQRQLADALTQACAAGRPMVVVDLARTTFLDSTALAALARAGRAAADHGCRIVVAGARSHTATVFQLTGLTDRFDVQSAGTPWPWPEARRADTDH